MGDTMNDKCGLFEQELRDRIRQLERDVQKFMDHSESLHRQCEAERNRNHELRQQITELRGMLDAALQAYHRAAAVGGGW